MRVAATFPSILTAGLLLSGLAQAQQPAGAPAAQPAYTPAQPGSAVRTAPGAGTQVVAEQAAPPAAAKAATGYDLKIRNLEQKVNELKEKIFRSKARLNLLKETVLHGRISGAKALLVHRNEMGSSFRLEQVIYSLDGAPIFQKVDQDGDLDEKEEFEVFNGAIVPGDHNLSVQMTYRGHGYGIFSYLQGYVFRIKSSFTFNAEEGKVLRLKAVGYEKGGITTDLQERPDIRFEIELLKEDPAATAEASAESGT